MLAEKSPVFLLASPEPEFLNKTEPVLLSMGAQVQVVMTAPAALAAMMTPKPPDLVLLDVDLPGMPIERLLAGARLFRGTAVSDCAHLRCHDANVD
ncbi:MAG: hypothetical protein ACLQHF_08605 [Terracidiphilus sp.]